VGEFLRRKWLKELGYVFDPSELDVLTADSFVIIGQEFQRLAGENGRQSSNRTRGNRKKGP
jgi:hypothetical protein